MRKILRPAENSTHWFTQSYAEELKRFADSKMPVCSLLCRQAADREKTYHTIDYIPSHKHAQWDHNMYDLFQKVSFNNQHLHRLPQRHSQPSSQVIAKQRKAANLDRTSKIIKP